MSATEIQSRQIADGAITNSKVAAGAGIDSSKLADGGNWIKKDGSVALTGNLNANSSKVTNLANPSASSDAANKSYVDTQVSSLNQVFKIKPNCRAATTGNITISNPGTAVFDGVTLTAGEYLLVKSQSSAAENGIYSFDTSSTALVRISQMDAWLEVNGAITTVDEGTVNADTMWMCTSNSGGTIGSTAITWTQIPTSPGYTTSNFVDKEVPSGAINGSNAAYTLANTPTSGSEHVFLNGILQESGSGNDYTISGTTLTMATAPLTGEKLVVSYRK